MGLKAYSGQGTIYMRPVTAAGVKTDDFRQVGTAYPLSLQVTNEQIKVFGRTVENANQVIAAKNRTTEIGGTLVLKEWNAANLAWALSGGYASQAAAGGSVSSGSPDVVTVPAPGEWAELTHRDVSDVVVKSPDNATTYVEGTAYTVDYKLGLINAVAGGALAAGTVSCNISYTYAAKTGYTVSIGSSSQIRVEILAHLYDEYSQEHWVLELDSVVLGSNSEINFISEPESEGEDLSFVLTPETLSGQSSCGRVNGISL